MTLPTIERHDRFWVVRDDIHPGGTKQIVLKNALPELGKKSFVYVASVFGKGGAALAYACAELGYQATIFIARNKTQPQWLNDIEKIGAKIVKTDPKQIFDIEPEAIYYAENYDAHYIEQGFAFDGFEKHLIDYAKKLPMQPKELWCPVVSGTMAGALDKAFPDAAMNAVAVVKHHGYSGEGKIYEAPEKYVRGAAIPPPYPSWTYSDAKVWRFAKKHGSDDSVIWNSNA